MLNISTVFDNLKLIETSRLSSLLIKDSACTINHKSLRDNALQKNMLFKPHILKTLQKTINRLFFTSEGTLLQNDSSTKQVACLLKYVNTNSVFSSSKNTRLLSFEDSQDLYRLYVENCPTNTSSSDVVFILLAAITAFPLHSFYTSTVPVVITLHVQRAFRITVTC